MSKANIFVSQVAVLVLNHFTVSTFSRTHEIQTMDKTSNDVESTGHSATGEMSSNDLEPMGSKCGRGNETPKRVPCSQKKQEVYR